MNTLDKATLHMILNNRVKADPFTGGHVVSLDYMGESYATNVFNSDIESAKVAGLVTLLRIVIEACCQVSGRYFFSGDWLCCVGNSKTKYSYFVMGPEKAEFSVGVKPSPEQVGNYEIDWPREPHKDATNCLKRAISWKANLEKSSQEPNESVKTTISI